jgi:3-isopropylmalate dehydrogenase
MCLNPGQFDVMVMENMFGDILSDQAGGILGSLGLMPSACLGPDKAYYEPSHGSAPDIAGQNIANPYSMIGSVAMMLEMSFGLEAEARNVWSAMQSVFAQGNSTSDLSKPGEGVKMISTQAFGDLVVSELDKTPISK